MTEEQAIAIDAAMSALERASAANQIAHRRLNAVREEYRVEMRDNPLRPSGGFRSGGSGEDSPQGGWLWAPAAALVFFLSAAFLSCGDRDGPEVTAAGLLADLALVRGD